MAPHLITDENQGEARDALRDILLLYVELAECYSGFGHAANVYQRFDPLRFVDAELASRPGYAPLVDLDFLHVGPAIAILCALYDEWCEFEEVDGGPFREAILTGRLSHVPDVERVAREAIGRGPMPLEDPWFEAAVEPIYQRHVIGRFEALSKMHRRKAGAAFATR